MYILSVYIVF